MARLTKAQILSLTPEQIDKMAKSDLKQLKRITSDLQAINKKSFQRLSAKGMKTGFVRGYEATGGPKSLKSMVGKNAASQVKAEFQSQLSLISAKTRTISGAKNVYMKMIKSIDPEHKVFPSNYNIASKEEISQFWELYHKTKEFSGERVRSGSVGSELDIELANIITDEMRSDAVDDMLANITSEYSKLYEERQAGIIYESNPLSITSE